MRAVPRLCEFYPGICLTTEEKAWKNLSQGKTLQNPQPHITKHTHTLQNPQKHTHTLHPHIRKPSQTHQKRATHYKTLTIQNTHTLQNHQKPSQTHHTPTH